MVIPCMGRVLGFFQDQVVRKPKGRLPWRRLDRKWYYTSVDAGFELTETYIQRSQNTVTQYIATQLLLEICEAAERNQGERVGMQWWEQAGIDLAAMADVDEDGMEE